MTAGLAIQATGLAVLAAYTAAALGAATWLLFRRDA
jgi:hypothetical protein